MGGRINDIAAEIVHIVSRASHVGVNEIVVRPAKQAR